MATNRPRTFPEDIRILFHAGRLASDSDRDLLERFAHANDQLAFEALLARHGPMVWSTCRDRFQCEQTAKDVFQATFLALTRHRKRLAVSARTQTLGPWLHRVADLA